MRHRLPALVSLVVVGGALSAVPFMLSDYNVSLAAQVGIFFVAVFANGFG